MLRSCFLTPLRNLVAEIETGIKSSLPLPPHEPPPMELDLLHCLALLPSLSIGSKDELESLLKSLTRQKLTFSNLDLESNFFGLEEKFEGLLNQTSDELTSLSFENCGLRLGRLIELLAFCRNLKELIIIDCPLFFTTSTEILNWAPFIPHFFKRLRALKSKEKDSSFIIFGQYDCM
jgi:hypothetical protein